MKNTRKSLVLSALSMLLCVAMLLGTTFAWFTDSVTSGTNKITAGNLDIELEYSKTMADGSWKTVENATKLFTDVNGNDILWEPGATSVVYLKITNKGGLALKYNLGINIAKEVSGTNVYDQEFKLSDYIKFGQVEDVTAKYDNRAAAVAAVDSSSLKIGNGYTLTGKMTATNETKVIALVVYLPESVGNDANYKTGTTAPYIDMGVEIKATQLASESDSFDNQYDITSPWLGGIASSTELASITDSSLKTVKISSAEQLAAFALSVNQGTSYGGYTVTLEKDIDLNNVSWTPINYNKNDGMTFDGQNHTILNLKAIGSKNVGLFGEVTGGAIKNVKIDKANITGVAYVAGIVGSIYGEVNNCVVLNSTINAIGEWDGTKYNDGAKAGAIVGYLREESGEKIIGCSAEKVTINGYRDLGGIAGCTYDANTLTGNTVTKVTINQGDYSNYEDGTYTTLGAIYGRCITGYGTGTFQDNTGDVTINDVTVVTPVTAQTILDNAKDGDVIILKAGTYDTLYLRQNLANSTARSDLDKDASYPAYYRELKNITIKAGDGATVNSKGIVAEAGLFWYSSAPASNQSDMNKATGGFISYLDLENITIDGITFDSSASSAIVLRDNMADNNKSTILVDGLTIKNCVGTGNVSNENIHFFSAGNGTNDQNFPGTTKKAFNNIVIKNNVFSTYYQPICMNNSSAVVNAFTIDGNTFNNCVDNQIQLANKVNNGDINITNNKVNGMSGRLIRMTNAQTTTTVRFSGNAINNPKKYDSGNDGTIAKVTGLVGFTVVDTNNGWTAGSSGATTTDTWQVMGDESKLPTE